MLHVKIYYTVSVNEPGDLHVEKKNVRREILIFLLKRGVTVIIDSIHMLRFRNLLKFYLIPDIRVSVSDSVE